MPCRLFVPLIAAVAPLAMLAGCAAAPRWQGPTQAPFDGRRFVTDEPFDRGFGDLLRWALTREAGVWRRIDATPRQTPWPEPPAEAIVIRVIGHATVLVQIAGWSLLTDPVWSERLGPISAIGPRRHVPPAIALEALPRIDAVLISHNHYDHMDLPTLRALERRDAPLFLVPLGDGALLREAGIGRVVEMDWWQVQPLGERLRVHAVPVRHWSQRRVLPSDRNLSLWAGYVIEDDRGRRILFAGDTGYGPHFRRIRDRLGPMDAALLPIGAYLPRWLTEYQHMDPGQAVQAHRDLSARRSVGIHWGTFELADEGQCQPRQDLAASLEAAGVPAGDFVAPDFGQAVVLN